MYEKSNEFQVIFWSKKDSWQMKFDVTQYTLIYDIILIYYWYNKNLC